MREDHTKEDQICLRIPTALKEAYEKRAVKEGRSLAWMIRRAMLRDLLLRKKVK